MDRTRPQTAALGLWLRCAGAVLVLCAGAWARADAPAPDPRATALIAELGLQQSATAARDMPGWRKPGRIVVAYADAVHMQQLRAAAPGAELVAAAEGDALEDQLEGAQAVLGICDEDLLDAAESLHWIQVYWVGVETCVKLHGLEERHIVLTNMQRVSALPIAEHAIAMTLALARGLPAFARQQQAGLWKTGEAERRRMREVGGRTMLVVGLGGIGTEVARRAHALGMRVIATRNSSREGPDFVARVGLPGDLAAFAAEADVVVNATPLTPETEGLFDADFFAAMKPGGYFISVGRGASTDTDALVDALRSGRLAGAGLDVTDPEPLPASHPLWSMPNVVITPHVASNSDVQDEREWILVVENLRRYAAGEALLNVVDLRRGY